MHSVRNELQKQLDVQSALSKSHKDEAMENEKKHLSAQELLQAQILRSRAAEESVAATESREKAIQEKLKEVCSLHGPLGIVNSTYLNILLTT